MRCPFCNYAMATGEAGMHSANDYALMETESVV